MHQNHHIQQIPLKINKNPKINPPSTITIPESAYGLSIHSLPWTKDAGYEDKSVDIRQMEWGIGASWKSMHHLHKFRLRNSDGWRGVDFWILIDFQWHLLEMVVLVHPQLCDLCGAALPGFFLSENTPLKKKHDF